MGTGALGDSAARRSLGATPCGLCPPPLSSSPAEVSTDFHVDWDKERQKSRTHGSKSPGSDNIALV